MSYQHQMTKRLTLPTVLREEEQAKIRKARKDVREHGAVRLVFVGGETGTGKSTMVEQALPSSCSSDGDVWITYTKFDQRNPDAPFTNIRSLLTNLVLAGRKSMNASNLDLLKKKLGSHQYEVLHSFLMLDTEDEQYKEEESSKLDSDTSEEFKVYSSIDVPKDAWNVLTSAIRACIRVLSIVAPIVLVIEDIHWGCHGTMGILSCILSDASLQNVFLCATFRTNEATATEGFYEWKQKLENDLSLEKVSTICLDNLSQQQLQEWLADALNRETGDTELVGLAEIVIGCTHGNLFFTKHFLEKLQDDELLSFNMIQCKWQWDCAIIKKRSSLSDNVVQTLLASRIHKLAPHVQSVLMLAACFGAQFDVRALEATKSALSIDCAITSLEEARKGEFVIQLNRTHYKFAHDMIQLAAYDMLPAEGVELSRLYWKIGNLLVKEETLMKIDTIFFPAVGLLNLGMEANIGSLDDNKRCLLAKLNHKAGWKATKLSSFEPAAQYLRIAVQAMGDKPFERNRDIATKVFCLLASTEYVAGNIEASLQACNAVIENAADCKEKIVACSTKLDCYVAMNDAQAFIRFCFDQLETIGYKFPKKATAVFVQLEYQKMKQRLKGLSEDVFLSLPALTEIKKEIALQLLCRLMFPLYQSEEGHLCTLVACHVVNITIKHGWSKTSSGKGITLAASYIASQSHDIKETYRLGKLAERRIRQDGLNGHNLEVLSFVHTLTFWWLEPVTQGLELHMEANRAAMRLGRMSNAFQATLSYSTIYFYTGLPLEAVLEDMEKWCEQYLEYNQMLYFFMGSPLLQAMRCLTGKEKNPGSMYAGEVAARRNMFPNPEKTGEQAMQSFQMVLSYYLFDLPEATKMAKQLRSVNPGLMKSSFWYTSRRFLLALIAIANCRQTHHFSDRAEAEKQLKYFRTVVKAGAINLVHKLQLLEAEMLTLGPSWRKDVPLIFDKYDEAIVSATRAGFLQDAAQANYLCFEFCTREKQRPHLADMYLKQSFELWTSWGAVAVASALMDRHKDVFGADGIRSSLSDWTKDGRGSSNGSVRSRPHYDPSLFSLHKELNLDNEQ